MAEQARDNIQRNADLQGRVAVVTGSSSGIGRAIAIKLAAAGCDVVVHGRANREGASETNETIRSYDRNVTTIMADLTDRQASHRFVEEAWRWRSGVDIWVNNAGADVLTTAVADSTLEEKLRCLWNMDVQGTIRISRLVGERMKAANGQGQPTIINMGWDQAHVGMGGDSGEMFGAAKGAVMAFTLALAKSLAPRVRVNCIAPGWIKTSWGATAPDYWQQRAVRESLMQRWGTADDVANVARFLASPAADFITGQIVAVNGGLGMAADTP